MLSIEKSLVFLFLLTLMFSFSTTVCFATDKPEADGALSQAESSLASAYSAVAEAENTGANVAELLVRLKLAGNWLASAHNAYRMGEYDGAYFYAMNCSDSVAGIVSEAANLKADAERSYAERLFLTEGFSSIGLSALFALGLFWWRFLKNKYVERVLKMKPEVVKAE